MGQLSTDLAFRELIFPFFFYRLIDYSITKTSAKLLVAI